MVFYQVSWPEITFLMIANLAGFLYWAFVAPRGTKKTLAIAMSAAFLGVAFFTLIDARGNNKFPGLSFACLVVMNAGFVFYLLTTSLKRLWLFVSIFGFTGMIAFAVIAHYDLESRPVALLFDGLVRLV